MNQTISNKPAQPPKKGVLMLLGFLATCFMAVIVATFFLVDGEPPSRVVRAGRTIISAPNTTPVMSKPNDGSRRLAELPQHTVVHVTDRHEGGWTLVQYGPDKQEGFVQTDDITPAKFARPAQITGKQVSLKENPSDNQPTIKILHPPDSVDYLDNFDERWARVCMTDGTWGFIEAKELKVKK